MKTLYKAKNIENDKVVSKNAFDSFKEYEVATTL